MSHSVVLAGLLAALLSTSAFAQSSLLDQTPSPTIVYGDIVTFGGAAMGEAPATPGLSEAQG